SGNRRGSSLAFAADFPRMNARHTEEATSAQPSSTPKTKKDKKKTVVQHLVFAIRSSLNQTFRKSTRYVRRKTSGDTTLRFGADDARSGITARV
ncbi:unnamed protein product, partial [Sphacelaria rigidula]